MSWSDWGWNMVTQSVAGVGEVISDVIDSIEPTLSVVDETTTKILSDIAEFIDVPEDLDEKKIAVAKEQDTLIDEIKTISPDGIENNNTNTNNFTNNNNNNNKIEYDSPLISILQSGADYVGDVIQQGVDVIQKDETLKSVYEPIVGFGVDVANQSLNVLESVGASVMDAITTEVGPKDRPKTVPFFFTNSETEPQNQQSQHNQAQNQTKTDGINIQQEDVFTIEFVNQQGPEILDRLQNISIENQLKYQSSNQKLMLMNFDEAEALGDIITEMTEILEQEKLDENVKYTPPTFLENPQKYNDLISALQKNLNEKPNLSEISGTTELEKSIYLQNQCCKKLATTCIQIIIQYEMLGELLSSQQSINDIKLVANFIKNSSDFFEQRIQSLVDEYIALIQLNTTVPFEDIKNKIFISMGKCISNTQNAKTTLIPLCKYLLAKKFETT